MTPAEMLRAGVAALVLVASLVWFAPARAAEITAENVAEQAAAAKTPADYQALAAYYRSLAAAEAGKVKQHETMLASFEKMGGKTARKMRPHCRGIIGASTKLQKDYEAMAAEYEEMAKGSQ